MPSHDNAKDYGPEQNEERRPNRKRTNRAAVLTLLAQVALMIRTIIDLLSR